MFNSRIRYSEGLGEREFHNGVSVEFIVDVKESVLFNGSATPLVLSAGF